MIQNITLWQRKFKVILIELQQSLLLEELISPLFSTEWGRRVGVGALIGASVLTLAILIKLPFSWYQDIALIRGQSSISTAKSLSPSMTALIKNIPERHLFGSHEVVESSGSIPITSLQLRLVGVIKAVSEGVSRVIISEAGQPAKVYQIGDSLPSGVEVYAIASDGVILENGGRLEKLPLQRSLLEFQGLPKKLLEEE